MDNRLFKNVRGINSNQLKMIALITMLIDHIGAFLLPQYRILRIIGRLAFPIYCFMLVEGAKYTSNMKKYLIRLGAFALISEIPFNLCRNGHISDPSGQNVFFTLFIGLVMICLIEHPILKVRSGSEIRQTGSAGAIETAYSLGVLLGCAVLAQLLHTDYGFTGIVMIFVFYGVPDTDKRSKYLLLALVNMSRGWVQLFGTLAIIPIELYNGERGRKNKLLQYGFYAFYPVHMAIGALIGIALGL